MKKNSSVSRPPEARARYPIRAVSKLTGISIDTLFGDYSEYQQELVRLGGHIA